VIGQEPTDDAMDNAARADDQPRAGSDRRQAELPAGGQVDERVASPHRGTVESGPVPEGGVAGRDAQARGGARRRGGAPTQPRRVSRAGLPRLLSLAMLLPALMAFAPADAGATGPASSTSSAAAPAYRVYFGDLHDHTGFSDGKGTPEEAWAQAAAGGADFMALTDHREGLTPAEWARTLGAADSATSPTFVAIPAFEVKPRIGHLNVYGTHELPPVGLDGAALYDWIAAHGATAEWNHPTRNSDDFSGYAYWSATRAAAIALLEVVNGGSGLLYPDFESSYVRALDKGWRVMPAANGDIHDASWITSYSERTALLAPALTREALYEAMRARRGYATKLKGLVVDYTVGRALMGSVIAQTAGSLPVSVHVRGPGGAGEAVISRLEIVANGGKVVASRSGDDATADWTTTVPSVAGRYYYMRVWTKGFLGLDTKSAWTAPVWLEDRTAPHTRQHGAGNAWHTAPVTVTLSAEDGPGGAGVARTEYRLDGGPLAVGTAVVVSGDGTHRLEYRSVDKAGNAEPFHGVTVRIDTSAPVPLAPEPATARRGGSAVLRYQVDDATLGGGPVSVVIKVRSPSGTVVTTVRRAAQPVGVPLRARVRCGFAPGAYRFSVYATDAAGNEQRRPGVNTLTVTGSTG